MLQLKETFQLSYVNAQWIVLQISWQNYVINLSFKVVNNLKQNIKIFD